MIVEDCVR